MESRVVPIPPETAGPAFPCPLPPLPLQNAANGVTPFYEQAGLISVEITGDMGTQNGSHLRVIWIPVPYHMVCGI